MNDDEPSGPGDRETWKAALLEQREEFLRTDQGVEREAIEAALERAKNPHAVVISGLRRVGKSTLLRQIGRRLGPDSVFAVDFDDERFLRFGAADFPRLHELLIELFGERRIFLLDEVQDVPAWETFVRRLVDSGFKVFLTGSNASLLSRELGTRLTGRYVPVELYPFSFREYLRFRGRDFPDPSRLTTADRGHVSRWLSDYLREGGIPDALKYPGSGWERTLYENILYRDIAARHQIGDVRALKELAFFFMGNPATMVSFNRLKGRLGLGSPNTVRSYVDHFEAGWLFLTLTKFDDSVRRQQIAPKKVYPIDTGLARAVGFMSAPNRGHLLEGAVHLHLRRTHHEIYYVRTASGREVDFYLPREGLLVQAAETLEGQGTLEREVGSLKEAMREMKVTRGLVVHGGLDAPPLREKGVRFIPAALFLAGAVESF